jgi:LmbE family N-acetylglucosaminyl deacetylase
MLPGMGMNYQDAATLFQGVILVIAPHMDDEMLACGATMAALPSKQSIHVIYATDGARSPVPNLPWSTRANPALVSLRMEEAKHALDSLGIPPGNAVFLGLPDGTLKTCEKELAELLATHIMRVQPEHVFAPFRLDRHPDHVAVHRATLGAMRVSRSQAIFNEYFVYFRWRLLPGGDIRKLIRDDRRICIPVTAQATTKRKALACYASQTTKYFEWQSRPILAPGNIEEVCSTLECFLQTAPGAHSSQIFTRWSLWIHCAHELEPRLKQIKEWTKSIRHWLGRRPVHGGDHG